MHFAFEMDLLTHYDCAIIDNLEKLLNLYSLIKKCFVLKLLEKFNI